MDKQYYFCSACGEYVYRIKGKRHRDSHRAVQILNTGGVKMPEIRIVQIGGVGKGGKPVDYLLEDGTHLHNINKDACGCYREFDPEMSSYVLFIPCLDETGNLLGFIESAIG